VVDNASLDQERQVKGIRAMSAEYLLKDGGTGGKNPSHDITQMPGSSPSRIVSRGPGSI